MDQSISNATYYKATGYRYLKFWMTSLFCAPLLYTPYSIPESLATAKQPRPSTRASPLLRFHRHLRHPPRWPNQQPNQRRSSRPRPGQPARVSIGYRERTGVEHGLTIGSWLILARKQRTPTLVDIGWFVLLKQRQDFVRKLTKFHKV